MAKLKDSDVPVIKQRIADGEVQCRLAEEYGVTPMVISNVKLGKNWAWKAPSVLPKNNIRRAQRKAAAFCPDTKLSEKTA